MTTIFSSHQIKQNNVKKVVKMILPWELAIRHKELSRNQKHQPMILNRLLLNTVQCTDYLTGKDNKWVIHVKIGKQNTHVTPQDKADPGYICKFPHSSEFTRVFL